MLKKVLSIILSILMIFSLCAILASCDISPNAEFPVTINDTTIKTEPKSAVVLSDNFADIISYIGYELKMAGRSEQCDQDFLSVIPSVGIEESPDIDSISLLEADLVICDSSLQEQSKKKLEEKGITVLELKDAKNFKELKQLYIDIGSALGGKQTGKKKAEEAYTLLLTSLETFKDSIPKSISKSSCYLYLDKDGDLATFAKGSIEAQLFEYNGTLNIFKNADSLKVDTNVLRISTPAYIFYDNDETLKKLQDDSDLSEISAVKENKVCKIPMVDFKRQGTSWEKTVYTMIHCLFEEEKATPDEETIKKSESITPSTSETIAATEKKATDKNRVDSEVGFMEDDEE